LLKYIIANTIFLLSLLFGVFGNNVWCLNIAYFIAWFVIIVSLLMLNDHFHQGFFSNIKKRSAPVEVDIFFDVLVVAVLAANASWITAAFYFLHIPIMFDAWRRFERK
jgi:hypothetical protein